MSMTVGSSVAGYDPSSFQASFQQRGQDFKALDSALQSGDLSSAQSAFATFQKDVQGGSSTGPGSKMFAAGSQASKDLQAVQNALSSGDIATAQKAFATLKQDLQSARGAHKGHHHHHSDSDSNSTSSTTGTAPTPTTGGQTVGTVLNAQA